MKKYLKLLFIILGILFIICPYFINEYSIIRLLSLFIGGILLCLGLIYQSQKISIKIFIYPLLIILVLFSLDYFGTRFLKMTPIISIKYKSSESVETYNSFLYRVYKCDNKKIFDDGYQKSYPCNNDDIKKISINKFLQSPHQIYKDSKNKFIHLKGKVTTIKGESSIELNSFDNTNELNGYVNFDENKRVVIQNIKINPKDYHVYDLIEVIGLVSNYSKKDDIEEIYLTDAKIISSNIYDTYELVINNNYNLDKIKINDNIYYVGINNIYYKYDKDNIYELGYILLDERESINNLIKESTMEKIEDIGNLYPLNDFNILKCNNKNTLIIRKDINNFDNICEIEN